MRLQPGVSRTLELQTSVVVYPPPKVPVTRCRRAYVNEARRRATPWARRVAPETRLKGARCRALAEARHERVEAQRSGRQSVRPGCQRPRRREIGDLRTDQSTCQ